MSYFGFHLAKISCSQDKFSDRIISEWNIRFDFLEEPARLRTSLVFEEPQTTFKHEAVTF